MQPELLNHQRLQESLKVYRIPLKGDETRSELLKLFEDHVRPKPQRVSSNPHKTNASKPAGEQKAATQCTTSAHPLPSKRAVSSEETTLDTPTSKKLALPTRSSIPRCEAESVIPEGSKQRRSSGGDSGGSGNSSSRILPQKRNSAVQVCVCVCFSSIHMQIFVDVMFFMIFMIGFMFLF